MPRKVKYDYYQVDLTDLVGDFTAEELLDLAIDEARERSRIYAIPCEWQAEQRDTDCEGMIRVRRARYA